MGEFFFVVKSLLATIVILFIMQIRIGGVTLETSAHNWIQTSPIAKQLEKVAAGGVLAVRNAAKSLTDISAQAVNNTDVQKASRFDFEIKRSPSQQQSKSQKNDYLAP